MPLVAEAEPEPDLEQAVDARTRKKVMTNADLADRPRGNLPKGERDDTGSPEFLLEQIDRSGRVKRENLSSLDSSTEPEALAVQVSFREAASLAQLSSCLGP